MGAKELPQYRELSLEEVSALLTDGLGYDKVTQVMDEGGIKSVEWKAEERDGLFNSGPIVKARETLMLSKGAHGGLEFTTQIDDALFATEGDGKITPREGWTDPKISKRVSPAQAMWYFLIPYATAAQHSIASSPDIFGFQFGNTGDKGENYLEVRIGGAVFRFEPNKGANTPVAGKVSVRLPVTPPSEPLKISSPSK